MAKFNYVQEMRKLEKEEQFQKEIEAKLQSKDNDAAENWREWQEKQRQVAVFGF